MSKPNDTQVMKLYMYHIHVCLSTKWVFNEKFFIFLIIISDNKSSMIINKTNVKSTTLNAITDYKCPILFVLNSVS